MVNTFDGAVTVTDPRKPSPYEMVLNGKRLDQTELDNYKLGDFYLVRSDNVQIQARFTAAGGLDRSSITQLKLTGSAFGGKVATISTDAAPRVKFFRRFPWQQPPPVPKPIQKVWFDGIEIGLQKDRQKLRNGVYTYHNDGTTQLSSVRQSNGRDMYTFKFVGDTTVVIRFEFMQFSNVPEGMLDLSIEMNRRKGLTGLCGDMDGDWKNDGRFVVNYRSCIHEGNLFEGSNPCHGMNQKECSHDKRAAGRAYCAKKHIMSQSEINGCIFDYCIGGEEMADAGVDFQKDTRGATKNFFGALPKVGNVGKTFPFGKFKLR